MGKINSLFCLTVVPQTHPIQMGKELLILANLTMRETNTSTTCLRSTVATLPHPSVQGNAASSGRKLLPIVNLHSNYYYSITWKIFKLICSELTGAECEVTQCVWCLCIGRISPSRPFIDSVESSWGLFSNTFLKFKAAHNMPIWGLPNTLCIYQNTPWKELFHDIRLNWRIFCWSIVCLHTKKDMLGTLCSSMKLFFSLPGAISPTELSSCQYSGTADTRWSCHAETLTARSLQSISGSKKASQMSGCRLRSGFIRMALIPFPVVETPGQQFPACHHTRFTLFLALPVACNPHVCKNLHRSQNQVNNPPLLQSNNLIHCSISLIVFPNLLATLPIFGLRASFHFWCRKTQFPRTFKHEIMLLLSESIRATLINFPVINFKHPIHLHHNF